MAKNAAKKTASAPVSTTGDNVVSIATATAKTRGRPKGSKNSPIAFDPSSLTIETGVAVPTKSGRGRKSSVDKYPFASMVVGSSFAVSVTSETADKLRSKVTNAAKAFKDANADFNYTSRLDMRDDGTGLLRLWRIEAKSA